MITKKDFEQFKKAIKKEDKWFDTCAFYMTKRQELLHTATVTLVGNFSYESQIKYYKDSIERVDGYDTWTQEEKDKNREYCLNNIQKYEDRLATYGTPEEEAQVRFEQLKNTNAFKKLAAMGVTIELVLDSKDCYSARFHY